MLFRSETATGGKVQVKINEAKTGLDLIDTTFIPVVLDSNGKLVSNTNARTFTVAAVNASQAALDLKFAGADSLAATALDGKIEGGQLIGVKISDRFFMKDVSLQANLALTAPAGINASANLGFITVNLAGTAALDARLAVGLKDPTESGPGMDGQISLTEFINVVTGKVDFKKLIDKPSLTGLGQLGLGINVDGLGSFITVPLTASIGVDANAGDLFKRWGDSVDLSSAAPSRTGANTIELTGLFKDKFLRGALVQADTPSGLAGSKNGFTSFVASVTELAGKTTVTLLPGAVLPATLTGLTIGTPDTPQFDFHATDRKSTRLNSSHG